MAKYTSRYGFELPEGVDKVAPNPFNDNFIKVDSLIKALDKKYIVKGTYTGNGVIATIGQIVEQNIEIGAKPVMLILDTVGVSRPHNDHMENNMYSNDYAHDVLTFGRPELSFTYNDNTYTIAKLTDDGFKVSQCGYSVFVDGKKKPSSQGYNMQGEEYYYIAFCDELPGNADAELSGEKAQMNYLGELDSLPDTVVAGDACTVDGSLYVFYDGGWIKASGGGSSGGCFKKIGYSDDCDYKVVSESSASAVFSTVIAEANDGDTIYIMPGTYAGSEIFVAKNINFIGVGEVILTFKVNINCDYHYDEENYELTLFNSYRTGWENIFFKGGFHVVGEDTMGNAVQSYANCYNCRFESEYIKLSGVYVNCVFDIGKVITTGQYFGLGSDFYDCAISCHSLSTGYNSIKNCDITFNEQSVSYTSAFGGGGTVQDCRIYVHRTDVNTDNDHSDLRLTRCHIFGYSIDKGMATITQCYHYAGAAL